MKNKNLFPRFFLGANTPLGFFSKFDYLYDPTENWFCYILKGGPGTGKSTLMKKIAEVAVKNQVKTEIIHCASDPNSLDAVIFPELKKCVVDGTAPHVIDPVYPGVSDTIINLGEFWNKKKLCESQKEIIKFTNENAMFHKKKQKYLTAYGSIDKTTTKIVEESIDYEKLNAYITRMTKKLIKNESSGQKREIQRFISSPTPDGFTFFVDTIEKISSKNFVIEDKYGLIGSTILEGIKTYALNKNYDIISCFSPLAPKDKLEALFIPEINLGFVVTGLQNKIKLTEAYKKINANRFLNKNKLANSKFLLSFNKKVNNAFLKEAIENLNNARIVHDKLEKIYSESMNYKKVNKIADNLISDIF